MSTVRDTINGSLRLLGALASGETAAAQEQADALSALNIMLDSWSTQKLLVYSIVRETFPFVAGQQTYTMGSGGDFNTTRPQKIDSALFQDPSNNPAYELPLNILTSNEWQKITIKQTASQIPLDFYFDPAYPLANVSVWPVPSDSAKNLVLYSWKPISNFADVNASVSFPPGYELALRSNLALHLAPEYGVPVSADLGNMAQTSKAAIKRINFQPATLGVDSALVRPGVFSIITGWVRR